MDYREYRVLETLMPVRGWLTRWRVVRKALDHMPAKKREQILTGLETKGLIESRVVWRQKGPGARASQYRLTKEGRKAYKTVRVEDEKVYLSSKGSERQSVKPEALGPTNTPPT